MKEEPVLRHKMTRRLLLGAGAAGGLALVSKPSLARTMIDLALPGGPGEREIITDFPEKGPMILQRTRAPLLETPFNVFDKGVFTPNDQFYVRWHWPAIPGSVDAETFALKVHGQVNQELSLSLKELLTDFPQVELAAVNQCSGNSRGFFEPRIPGGEWANGAMGNALWTGVRLKDVLDRAGVKAGAVHVRFTGLDGAFGDAPRFIKSLEVDHARDGEVMIAYAMNGEQLPLLNGFPLRLVVPGWFSTYWIKMLDDIEVLDHADDNYWMKTAYKIPDTPGANMEPGQAGVPMVPISTMVPRSFTTNLKSGDTVSAAAPLPLRGIAFGGDSGVARVDVSTDGGKTWQEAQLGKDEGKYGFRQWHAEAALSAPGKYSVLVRCTNENGMVQPSTPNWNPGGYMRNVIESTDLVAT
jgi:DMSO/TMAO reductase YedYZ molybdopterin-dependent catalytic subunit